MYLPFVTFLIEAAAAHGLSILIWLYFRFVLAVQIARALFNQHAHKPYHYFITVITFHRGLTIRIIRPRNRTALTQTTIRHIYFTKCAHVWRTGHMIKFQTFMADNSQGSIMDSF